MNDKMREEFEQWFKLSGLLGFKETAWFSWQASRAALEIELPPGGFYAGYDNDHMMESRDVREALEAAGVKVKA